MLGLDALCSFRAKIKLKTLPKLKIPLQKSGHGSVFSQYVPNSQLLGFRNFVSKVGNYGSSGVWLGGQTRFYYVDRNSVHYFKLREIWRWFQDHRNESIVVVLVGSGALTVYFKNIETVPYSRRKQCVLLSVPLERRLGEHFFKQEKYKFKGKILSEQHPTSIRVKLIATNIIEALQRGLKQENVWRDADKERKGQAMGNLKVGWLKEDQVLEDRWVQKSRKKGMEKGSRSHRRHLDEFNWEVIVVEEPQVNAFCIPGGKIVVFTGLLKHFKTDEEIAAIIGHEVAHAVAQHTAEGITLALLFIIPALILEAFLMPDLHLVDKMSKYFLQLPFSRRMEMEADYIGLLLMASAGYDPRVGPKVEEKFGQITRESALDDYLSTHPSSKKRAQALAQPKVMDEALSMYRQFRRTKAKKRRV
ncbi:unnamed protein product [Rhodiola kirilowii]